MRKILVAAVAAGLAMTAGACSNSGAATGSGNASPSLALAALAPVESFKPGDFGTGPSSQFVQPVYDSLLRNDNNGEPAANIATAWEYDSTNTTLSLTLRDDVTFTDGTKLDGAAVKANLEIAKKGTGESGNKLRQIDRVDVVDATHVKVVLSAPDPSLLPSLGSTPGMLASPKALASESIKTEPVGSGPYVFDKTQSQLGTKYVYRRNAAYWNRGAYPYDTIALTVFVDNNAIQNALRSGQVDFGLIAAKDVAGLKGAGLNTVRFPSYTTTGLYLFDREGKSVPALKDVRVRQALNHAFDRATILQQVYGGAGAATTQLFSTQSTGFDAALDTVYPYDVAKAKQLLTEAGYPNGFTLPMPDVSPVYPAQQAATTEALKAIGVTPDYKPVNGQTFISDLISGKYPAAIFNLDMHRAWDTTQVALAPQAVWNTYHVADPTVTDLIGKAQKETGDQQAASFKQLNKYIVEQAWFAPWVQADNDYAVAKDVTVTSQKYAAVAPIWNFAPAK